jgi:hypothetical protein
MLFFMIFSDSYQMSRPVINFVARKAAKKMGTFLEFPYSNTLGTLLLKYETDAFQILQICKTCKLNYFC